MARIRVRLRALTICDMGYFVKDPDRRGWEVKRVWLLPTQPPVPPVPPEAQRREGFSGRVENALDGAERLVTRYKATLRSWPVIGLAVVATVIALIVGSATGTTAYAVITLVGVAIVLTLPLWIGEFLSYAFQWVMLILVISGAAAGNRAVYVQMKAGHSQGSVTERYVHAPQVLFPGAAEKGEARVFSQVG